MRPVIAFALMLIIAHELRAQEEGFPPTEREEWKGIDPRPASELFDRERYEDERSLRSQPLDLNRAEKEDLLRVPGLMPDIVARLIAWRSAGPIRSIVELRAIPGMTDVQLLALRLYTVIHNGGPEYARAHLELEAAADERDLRSYGRRAPDAEGTDIRMTAHWDNDGAGETIVRDVEAGFRLSKNPGERALADAVRGYCAFRPAGTNVRIIAGTYRVKISRGLVLGGGTVVRSGVMDLDQREFPLAELRPTLSNDDIHHGRGMALEARTGSVTLIVAASQSPLHGTKDSSGTLVSLSTDGLFRTEEERARRNAALLRACSGVVLVRPWSWLDLALAADVALSTQPVETAGRMARWRAVTSAVRLHGSRASAELEFARDDRGTEAWHGRVNLQLHRDVLLGAEGGMEEQTFFAPHGATTSLSSVPSRGGAELQTALEIRPSGRVGVLVGYSERRIPVREHAWTLDLPVREWNGEIRFIVSPANELAVRLRRVETSAATTAMDENDVAGTRIGITELRVLRLSFDALAGSGLRSRTRVDLARSSDGSSGGAGILTSEELILAASGISLRGRITLFDVDAYGARLYGIDPELPGPVQFTVFDGRGTRWMATARVSLAHGLVCSATFLQTVRASRSGTPNRLLPVSETVRIAAVEIEETLGFH